MIILSVCTWLQRSAVCCLLWRRVRHDDWQSWTFVIMSQHEDDSHAALSYAQINTFFECKDGVSLGFIAIVVLGILTMWYILFTKITMGRRKRDLSSNVSVDDSKTEDAFEFVKSAIFSGRSLYGFIKISPIKYASVSKISLELRYYNELWWPLRHGVSS